MSHVKLFLVNCKKILVKSHRKLLCILSLEFAQMKLSWEHLNGCNQYRDINITSHCNLFLKEVMSIWSTYVLSSKSVVLFNYTELFSIFSFWFPFLTFTLLFSSLSSLSTFSLCCIQPLEGTFWCKTSKPTHALY